MLALSLVAACSIALQGGQTPSAVASSSPVSLTTYILKVSDESKSLFRLLGATAPVAKYVLRSDSTFLFERVQKDERVTTEGTFSVSEKDVVFAITGTTNAMRAQMADDRLIVDGLTYLKVTDNITGLWVRQSPAGPDRSLRFRFNDKGRFWFQQGDPKPKDGSTPIGSEGVYRVEGDTIVLTYLKIDNEDAPATMPSGKLTLAGDRSYFIGASNQRYEKVVE
ncbi:MAG: hypothetical protein ACAH95_13490 [Fimbriimonas sp.]